MENGWVKLHRKLLQKSIWHDSTAQQKVILITLLMMANHGEREWEWQGQKYKAAPGQLVTSLQRIADNAGPDISIRNVRTALERFEKYGFLTNKSTNKNRLITIVNWANYQAQEQETDKQTDKQPTSNRQATDKQPTTNKNVRNKECKNENKIEYAPNVHMTETEYSTLETRFGQAITQRSVEHLDNYKGATGKKYTSDYRAILTWVIEKVTKERSISPPTPIRPNLTMATKPPSSETVDPKEIEELLKKISQR